MRAQEIIDSIFAASLLSRAWMGHACGSSMQALSFLARLYGMSKLQFKDFASVLPVCKPGLVIPP